MGRIFDWFFRPPPGPFLPHGTGLVEGARIIAKFIELVYKRGVFDGFIFGVLLTIVVFSARRRP